MSEAAPTITRVFADCTAAAVGSTEAILVTTVPKGSRVLRVVAQALIASDSSTDSTWWVGDTTDPDGLLQSFDTEQTVNAFVGNSTAAYMLTAGGKLYNAATEVNAYYTQAATDGATAPKIRVILWIATPGAP